MESLSDPEVLRDREEVAFHEDTQVLDAKEFETAIDALDNHVVIGLANREGAVLLANDGSHGWTLPAFVVEDNDDWMVTGQQGIERVTNTTAELTQPELVRRTEVRSQDDEDQSFSVYSVVFRASVEHEATEGEFNIEETRFQSVRWFDTVPDDQYGAVADDIRLFID